MDDLTLAADFPQATREQWLKLVEGVLKGADFGRKLVGRSHDGIAIQPLYPKAEGAAPVAREQAGRWRVSQRVDHPDPAKANELALLDLEGGADALTLVTRRAPASRGFGVRIDSLDDLDRALSGVMLDLIHLRLDAGGHGRQMAALVLALAERRGHGLSGLSLDLGLDPVGAMASLGRMSASWDAVAHRMGDTLDDLTGRGFKGRAFLADGRVYHEAGASEAQELAAVLATGLAYLRGLEAHGHGLDAARASLAFLLAADADEFLTVAKFRALRRLWARVEQACGLDPKPDPPPCGDGLAHDHPARPLGEHAARDDRRLLGRDRRGGRHRGPALHGGPGAPGRLRPPGGAQHADHPARRVQSRPRGRSGRRRGRLRGPHRRALRAGLGAAPGDRARGRDPGEPEAQRPAGAHRHCQGAAGQGGGHPQGADHRHERVPEPQRGRRGGFIPLVLEFSECAG
jgi:hypothetical protein